MPTEVLQPEVVQATSLEDSHIRAITTMLKLGAVLYIPCDAPPPMTFLFDMERIMPGSVWAYYGPNVLHGPIRFYGKCRIRVELKAGAMTVGGLG